MWAFWHPPEASWSAPGEKSVREAGERAQQRLERSAVLRVAVAAGALLLMGLVLGAGWMLSRPTGEESPAPAVESTEATESASEEAPRLPGAAGGEGADEPEESATAEPAGQEADEETLERINDGDGLITAGEDHADDPLVTGARFLRSLRTVDTTTDEVSDWYTARDSFLADDQTGMQEDWGEAGEQRAVSEAEISWAEMDAAIEDGRGIAPSFAYGPEVTPGTHLVQVGMRLDREITAGGETVETPSGALMEAVVVCPPATGVERCVVTDWGEEPSEFVSSRDESWEAGR